VPHGRAAGSWVATNQALPRGAEKIEGFLARERKNVSPSAERCTSAWDLCVVQDSIPAELGNVWRMLVDVSCLWATPYDLTQVANVSFVCVSCEQALFIRTVRTGFPLTTSHELPILGMRAGATSVRSFSLSVDLDLTGATPKGCPSPLGPPRIRDYGSGLHDLLPESEVVVRRKSFLRMRFLE